MPRPKRLSGDEVIAIFSEFGFRVHSQRGSHVKLRRLTPAGNAQTLTVPLHRELDVGTSQAVFRQGCKVHQRGRSSTKIFCGLSFAIAEFREMKMQPSLERALRHKEVLKA